jgi:hypothetical protein
MTADPAFTGQRPLLPVLAPHLQDGETVRWAARPDVYSVLRTKSALWWIGAPWLVFWFGVYLSGWLSWEWFTPFGLIGFAFVAAPFVLLFESDRTVYAITNRRALIVHNGMKHEVVSLPFAQMDEKLEVLETSRGAGHVYFASNQPTRLRDTDHTGKLAFRDVGKANEVARVLDAARKE